MTDRTTELLRKLLEERGVEWWETINHVNCIFTWWESPTFGIVHAMDNEDGETLYMACLNNCDFTPEQAIAATLGADYHGYEQAAIEAWKSIKTWNERATHGTLTAEQVREAAKSNSRQYESPVDDGVWIREYDWQAIADELNARAERTCRNTQSDFDFMCSECGKCVDNGRVIGINYCPNCGRKVVSE